ncbi:hypothetical protein NEIG_02322 [Nematocida sp. ERTm5]|nr:hypothetical protein NEIG_02322 [Nematocida sp. ERTm5]
MSLCNVCNLPTKEIDNGYVCPNGHVTTKLKEVDDETDWKSSLPEGKRRKYPQLKEIIHTLNTKDLCALIGVKYLHSLLKEYDIPYSAFSRYKELYYSFSIAIESLPEIKLCSGYRRIAEVFVFLVKRDLEEKKNNLYTLTDFTRKLDTCRCTQKYFLAVRRHIQMRYLRTVSKSKQITYKISSPDITNLLRLTFPNKKEYTYGIIGRLTEKALNKLCIQLGITVTPCLKEGYIGFKDTLDLLQFPVRYKQLCLSEVYIIGYLYLYFLARCSLTDINGYIHVVETPRDLSGGRVIQEFFSREHNISSLKQFNMIMNVIEQYNGNQAPLLNPMEYPSPDYGRGIIDSTVQASASNRILSDLLNVSGCSSKQVYKLLFKLMLVYQKYSQRIIND